MFQKSSYPFYKFGDIVPLGAIDSATWLPYLQRGFASRGKQLPDDIALKLCETVQLHPSYVQQLAWLTLLNTNDTASEATLANGLQDLISENSGLFIQQTERLTVYQLNFLQALLDGVNKDFGKSDVRERYQLGTYSNVTRIKNALLDKELIDFAAGGVTRFADPVFPLWLRQAMQNR